MYSESSCPSRSYQQKMRLYRRSISCSNMSQLESLQWFSEYINSTRITTGSTWPPSSWCVFGQSVRTNNDVEGWHNSLKRRAQGRSNLPYYMMVQLLHEEARLETLQIRLVSKKKLRRHQRRAYRELQSKIFHLWDSYSGEDGKPAPEGMCLSLRSSRSTN